MPKPNHRLLALPLTILIVLMASGAGATSIMPTASGQQGVSTPPVAPIGQPCQASDATTFVATDQLTGGEFSALTGSLGLSLDIAREGSVGSLLSDSEVTMSNSRGSLRLLLSAGSCGGAGGLSISGDLISGTGTWVVDTGTGSYRQATGSGTFNLLADLTAGIGRAWRLDLNGAVDVLQPDLIAQVVESSWRHRAGDPPGRVATVVFRVTNQGPGDAFATAFLEPDAPEGFALQTIELNAHEPEPEPGEWTEVTVRWSVRGLRGHEFDAGLHLPHTDALDLDRTTRPVVHVVVPS